MITIRGAVISATIVAILTSVAACASSTDAPAPTTQTVSSTPVVTSTSMSPSSQKSTCGGDPADTTYAPPAAISPRTDGVFAGHEDGKYLVILRYYPDHTAYLAVGLSDTPINTAKAWVTPSKNSNTGPFSYDTSGAFVKPVPAGDISYSVWKYTGDSLNLHAISHHGCREHTIFMTFVSD